MYLVEVAVVCMVCVCVWASMRVLFFAPTHTTKLDKLPWASFISDLY